MKSTIKRNSANDKLCDDYFTSHITPQALPINPCVSDDVEESTVSSDPFHYLKRVREERETDEVCKALLPEEIWKSKKREYKNTDFTKSSAALINLFSDLDRQQELPNKFVINEAETNYVRMFYRYCNMLLEIWREINTTSKDFSRYLRREDIWLRFSLPRDLIEDVKSLRSDEQVETCPPGDGGDDDDNVNDDDDEGDDDDKESTDSVSVADSNNDNDNVTVAASSPPLLSVISSLNQESITHALTHFQSVLALNYYHPRLGVWIISLLCSLSPPLPPNITYTLRDIARSCRKIRHRMVMLHMREEGDTKLMTVISGLKIIIVVVTDVFGQRDLGDKQAVT